MVDDCKSNCPKKKVDECEKRDPSRCPFDSEEFCRSTGDGDGTGTGTGAGGMMRLETAPFDPRFPNQNQTRYCYQSYVDFHRCTRLKGEGYEPCNYFKKVYRSMCPNAWVEKWDTQREEGRFPGNL